MLYEALKNIEPLRGNQKITVPSHIPLLHCIKLSPEEWTGIQIDLKLLTWKWYIQGRDTSFQGQPELHTEEICKMEIVLPEFIPRERQIHTQYLGKCAPSWSKGLSNAWFTDGSPSVVSGRTEWTAAAPRPWDNLTLREKGKTQFVQHVELTAVVLVVRKH